MVASSQQAAGAEMVKTTISGWSRQLQSYLRRLPLLTRAVVCAIPGVYLLELCGVPLEPMWALDPKKMDLSQSMLLFSLGIGDWGLGVMGADAEIQQTVHRLNTYPLVHTGLVHALMNLIALTPLLERFEREVGTLKTTLLIAGRELPLLRMDRGVDKADVDSGCYLSRRLVFGD
jgi:hypothetical protein